jgi:hypothetical protein
MTGLVRVVARVTVRKVVAAADLAARLAHPQMHPAAPDLEALLAARDLGRWLEHDNLVEV